MPGTQDSKASSVVFLFLEGLLMPAVITSSGNTTGCVISVCFLLIRQIVIRAHRQQLDEMARLCFKEECLINQMSAMVSVSDDGFGAC